MLEKHALPDQIIIKYLNTNYGIGVVTLTFLPIGADTNASIYKAQTFDQTSHKNGFDAWISKEEAVALANERCIHAILVHSSNGSLYLRPEYKGKRFRDLVC